MKILSIETSCDETAISIIEASGTIKHPRRRQGFGGQAKFKILGNEVASQIKIHEKYGGVFPMMAKREHSKNIIPILERVLKEARLLVLRKQHSNILQNDKINKILEREPELLEKFLNLIPKIKIPKIDAIAVTYGPGLEPALWVGLNFAKALSFVWKKKLIPVNHMEGHMVSTLIDDKKINKVQFPAMALLISGGHTEIVLMKDWLKYKVIGKTRDDAVGEAFDKVARMLGLPYPGGPQISKLAKNGKQNDLIKLPRPMINSKDFDFSFSGLKTAVFYLIRNLEKQHSNILQNDQMKKDIAKEFEDSVVEVLIKKTMGAVEKYKAKTLIIGGGVSANQKIRETFTEVCKNTKKLKVYFPAKDLSTDNSIMIAIAGFFRSKSKNVSSKTLRAQGNLEL
ncbi:MAG: tRNA (adenosine(37)-N6)-threonylcarbamoyltransferase complex transferase subunit TsaD [Candidatus Paceibacterota bacterium]|jgi:N6-L-threonylcarbamoyladenine synthase